MISKKVKQYLGMSTSLVLLLGSNAWAAQTLEYDIRWDTNDNRYHVFMRPTLTPSPVDSSSTGQVTIKAPFTGAATQFTPTSIQTPAKFGASVFWLPGGAAHGPSEDTGSSYLSFYMDSTADPSAFGWQASAEQEVFSFANAGTCLGPVSIMSSSDAFNAPNSEGTNPGNQFSNEGWSTSVDENNYLGNYGKNSADCGANNDNDGDGVINEDEISNGTDPNNPDTDGDGVPDGTEYGPNHENPKDTDGDGIIDPLDLDDDGDGVNTVHENYDGNGTPADDDTDGDGTPDYLDTDDDNDGKPSKQEGNDPNGNFDPADAIDTDGDGIVDYLDPNDTDGPNMDNDGDGVPNGIENDNGTDPNNPDTDGDGVPDGDEYGPDQNNPLDTDGDGTIDASDPDDDNDGVNTIHENYNGGTPLDDDTDKDGKPDYLDPDDDGDGKPSSTENNDPNNDASPADAVDTDGDGIVDYLDPDDTDGPNMDPDGDGVPTGTENNNGTDPYNPDTDGDGVHDGIEYGPNQDNPLNTDGDGSINALDTDDDNDGVLTEHENYNGDTPVNDDTDGNGVPDYLDTDDDGDGKPSSTEGNDPNGNGHPADADDSDGDGVPDYLDADDLNGPDADADGDGLLNKEENQIGSNPYNPDSDGDGIGDLEEVGNLAGPTDSDGDGIYNVIDPDDDNDGVLSVHENYNGNSTPVDDDSDSDGIADYLDTDDDGDGVLSEYEGNDPNGDGNPNDAQNTDGTGKPDYLDNDDDGDGLLTIDEQADPNGDGDPSDAVDIDQDGDPNYLDASTDYVAINLKAILKGASYNRTTGLMTSNLSAAGLIPSNQPYSAAPFNYSGSESAATTVLNGTGTSAIVDWVLVELRNASTPRTVVATVAALLTADGNVVDASNGSSKIKFQGVNPGNYHVVVRHRNHLGVMTGTAQALSPTPRMIDFTSKTGDYHGSDPMYTPSSSAVAQMWSADANTDVQLIGKGSGSDADAILFNKVLDATYAPANSNYNFNFIVNGYHREDLNLDGKVIFSGPSNDLNQLYQNVLTHPANAARNANYIVVEQLP